MSTPGCKALLFVSYALTASFCMLGVPALGKSMKVKCIRQPGSVHEKCRLDIYNSVLKGKNGNQVEVKFDDGYSAEAFCIDSEGKNCWVRSKNSQWEEGRVRWVQKYSGFKSAFFIENGTGLILGAYDAPPAY